MLCISGKLELAVKAKENVEGDFYCVDMGCDCGCGIPEELAPNLLKTTEDKRHQTYFYKQPVTKQEIELAIESTKVCPIHDIRYGGKEKWIIKKMTEEQCDYFIDELGNVRKKSKNT